MNGPRPQWHVMWHAVIAVVLSVAVALVPTASLVMAQATGMPNLPIVSLLRGEVTEVGRDYISIDNKRYDIRQDVIIQDERSQPKGLKDIEVGGFVAYHIKYGRIDQLVLVLPR